MRRNPLAASAFSLFLSVLTVGCSTGGQGPEVGEWVATIDTIGDTIVVETLSGSTWRDTAHLVPDVSIGVFDGPEEYILGNVVSLAQGADGTIYIGDHRPYLLAINPDGSFKWEFMMEESGDIYTAPSIGADGTIYVGTSATMGYLYAIE